MPARTSVDVEVEPIPNQQIAKHDESVDVIVVVKEADHDQDYNKVKFAPG
jgi:hypothetical protein